MEKETIHQIYTPSAKSAKTDRSIRIIFVLLMIVNLNEKGCRCLFQYFCHYLCLPYLSLPTDNPVFKHKIHPPNKTNTKSLSATKRSYKLSYICQTPLQKCVALAAQKQVLSQKRQRLKGLMCTVVCTPAIFSDILLLLKFHCLL